MIEQGLFFQFCEFDICIFLNSFINYWMTKMKSATMRIFGWEVMNKAYKQFDNYNTNSREQI